jgi:hypothetical protein
MSQDPGPGEDDHSRKGRSGGRRSRSQSVTPDGLALDSGLAAFDFDKFSQNSEESGVT